ncbi:MAG: hypothetical protein H6867_06775 [Rhodospirillales bacterium]|nr:hypothetical protein [Rhodospirillales bacterium]MCB9995253.1 hypothetical protein [Rhodospirillales bacterium]
MTDQQDKQLIIDVIEDCRRNLPEWVTDNCVMYIDVFHNLNDVEAYNSKGMSVCGMASDVVEQVLTEYFSDNGIDGDAVRVTSAVSNGTFHHYNVVRIGDHEPLLVDLTAAQFFFRPMDHFDGRPYFVGTRQELKDIVDAAAENVWGFVQDHMPDAGYRTLWDVDYKIYSDRDFGREFFNALKRADAPCSFVESYYYGWDITWGDQSRVLEMGNDLKDKFAAACTVPGLMAGRLPAIPNLPSCLTIDTLKLADGPS